jgi:FixJ family two-component response regulator
VPAGGAPAYRTENDQGTVESASVASNDVRMPTLDGIALQRQIAIASPHMPVIFVSAHEDEDAEVGVTHPPV